MEFDGRLLIARALDRLMHAAQYLVGVSKDDYSNPAVWDSQEAAVVLLRERYQFLSDMLEHLWIMRDMRKTDYELLR